MNHMIIFTRLVEQAIVHLSNVISSQFIIELDSLISCKLQQLVVDHQTNHIKRKTLLPLANSIILEWICMNMEDLLKIQRPKVFSYTQVIKTDELRINKIAVLYKKDALKLAISAIWLVLLSRLLHSIICWYYYYNDMYDRLKCEYDKMCLKNENIC